MAANSTIGVVSIPKAAMLFSTTCTDILINAVVFIGLAGCDLSKATDLLMRAQLYANGIGIVSALPFVKVLLMGQHVSSNEYLNSLPGAIGVFGLYIQMALLLCMAVNRYVVFCHDHKADYWFSASRTKLYIFLSVCYGMLHGLTSLLPCCRLVLDPRLHKMTYIGDGKLLKEGITLANDMVILPIAFICYVLTLKHMRKMRNSITTEERKKMRYQKEKKLLMQFLIIASVWLLYSILTRSRYFIPTNRQNTIWLIFCESVRFLVFVIDPIVYFCFMQKLRKTVLKKLCCCIYGTTVHSGNNTRPNPRINNLVV